MHVVRGKKKGLGFRVYVSNVRRRVRMYVSNVRRRVRRRVRVCVMSCNFMSCT